MWNKNWKSWKVDLKKLKKYNSKITTELLGKLKSLIFYLFFFKVSFIQLTIFYLNETNTGAIKTLIR